MSIDCSSKLQIFSPPVKMARKSLCVVLRLACEWRRNTICADQGRVSTIYMAIGRSDIKKFLRSFFQKATFFLTKLSISPINLNLSFLFGSLFGLQEKLFIVIELLYIIKKDSAKS